MSIEDSMYNVPLLANEYKYPYSAILNKHDNYNNYNKNEDYECDEEKLSDHIDPLEIEIEYETNNLYGYPFGINTNLEMSFKDKMLCLFTFCSVCFPINLIFLFVYKYG